MWSPRTLCHKWPPMQMWYWICWHRSCVYWCVLLSYPPFLFSCSSCSPPLFPSLSPFLPFSSVIPALPLLQIERVSNFTMCDTRSLLPSPLIPLLPAFSPPSSSSLLKYWSPFFFRFLTFQNFLQIGTNALKISQIAQGAPGVSTPMVDIYVSALLDIIY